MRGSRERNLPPRMQLSDSTELENEFRNGRKWNLENEFRVWKKMESRKEFRNYNFCWLCSLVFLENFKLNGFICHGLYVSRVRRRY